MDFGLPGLLCCCLTATICFSSMFSFRIFQFCGNPACHSFDMLPKLMVADCCVSLLDRLKKQVAAQYEKLDLFYNYRWIIHASPAWALTTHLMETIMDQPRAKTNRFAREHQTHGLATHQNCQSSFTFSSSRGRVQQRWHVLCLNRLLSFAVCTAHTLLSTVQPLHLHINYNLDYGNPWLSMGQKILGAKFTCGFSIAGNFKPIAS